MDGEQKLLDWELAAKAGEQLHKDSVEVEGYEGYDKEKVFEVIDQAITWSSKYNMYVFINFQGCGWPPTEEYNKKRVRFFQGRDY